MFPWEKQRESATQPAELSGNSTCGIAHLTSFPGCVNPVVWILRLKSVFSAMTDDGSDPGRSSSVSPSSHVLVAVGTSAQLLSLILPEANSSVDCWCLQNVPD